MRQDEVLKRKTEEAKVAKKKLQVRSTPLFSLWAVATPTAGLPPTPALTPPAPPERSTPTAQHVPPQCVGTAVELRHPEWREAGLATG